MKSSRFQSYDKIVVFGISGHGKTVMAARVRSIWPRQIILDIADDFPWRQTENEITVDTFPAFVQAVRNFGDKLHFKIVFKFNPDNSDGANKIIFEEILRVGYYLGDVLFVIEEGQEYASTQRISPWYKRVLLLGRHRNVGVITTTQRPGELHKTVFSQASHIYMGAIHEPNDLKYLRGVVGDHVDKLPHLNRGEFIYYSPGKAAILEKNK